MVGFLALASVVLALLRGGWWWALAIFLVLGWFGKRSEDKKKTNAPQEDSDRTGHAPPILESAPPRGATSNEEAQADTTLAAKVEQICAGFSSSDYYVADMIPTAKRANAMALYPPPGGGEIIALVDATLFGSAKNGLAVGANGISWHNDSLHETPISSLKWSQFASALLVAKGSELVIGEGNLDLSGSTMKSGQLIEVLSALQRLLKSERVKQPAKSVAQRPSAQTKPIEHIPHPPADLNNIVEVNEASFDDLLTLPGIGAAEAHLIIKRRGTHSFTSAADLVQFLDLKPHFATRLEGRTLFNPSAHSTHQVSGDAIVSTPAPRGRMID